MRHILISGGTGFFGKALLRYLLSEAEALNPLPRLSILSRNPKGFLEQHPEFKRLKGCQWIQVDLMKPQEVESACNLLKGEASVGDQVAVTHVLHAATESTRGPELRHSEQFHQIFCGTQAMLGLAKALNAKRFLLTSSGGAYGPQSSPTPIAESSLTLPNPLDTASAYGIGKRVSEHLCALAAKEHGFDCVVTRPFAFCGPDLPLTIHFAVGNFIHQALFEPAIVVKGDGTAIRSYLDQQDLAEWLLTMLFHGKAGEAYNIGSDEAISIADLAHKVRDLLAPTKPVVIQGKPDPSRPRHVYLPDTSKARTTLGLSTTVSLEQSIQRTAHEHRKTNSRAP